jgi:hypothetical protein
MQLEPKYLTRTLVSYAPSPPFFFLSSTMSMLSDGTPLRMGRSLPFGSDKSSSTSYATSPCTIRPESSDEKTGWGTHLDHDLVEALRVLRHGCAGCELLREELGGFLEIDVYIASSASRGKGEKEELYRTLRGRG